MPVKNSYPEKPVKNFFKSSIEMPSIILAIKALPHPMEVKRAAYVIVRNETANGKSVVNGNNFCGAQADSGRWPKKYDKWITGVTFKKENKTLRMRIFLEFDSIQHGLEFMLDRLQAKGVFIGENVDGKFHKGTVRTPEQLCDAYQDEWVKGFDATPTAIELKNFVSMYRQAEKIFV